MIYLKLFGGFDFRQTDERTDERTDICCCRVTFATEKIVGSIHMTKDKDEYQLLQIC